MIAFAPATLPESAATRGGHAGADRLAQGEEGLADGGGAECQCLQRRYDAIQHRAQRAALFRGLDHAGRHGIHGRQERFEDAVGDARGGQPHFGQRIVEDFGLGGGVAAELDAEVLAAPR